MPVVHSHRGRGDVSGRATSKLLHDSCSIYTCTHRPAFLGCLQQTAPAAIDGKARSNFPAHQTDKAGQQSLSHCELVIYVHQRWQLACLHATFWNQSVETHTHQKEGT